MPRVRPATSREYRIDASGLPVGRPLRGVGGILAGSAVDVPGARQEQGAGGPEPGSLW